MAQIILSVSAGNIGGDLRIAGTGTQRVSIADPSAPSRVVETLELTDGAIATSGGYYRYFEIGDERLSHIIDPRTARPVGHASSVSVLAKTAADADAMATALSVMRMEQALRWCGKHEGFECLIIDDQGEIHHSGNWPARLLPKPNEALPVVAEVGDLPGSGLFRGCVHRPRDRGIRSDRCLIWTGRPAERPAQRARLRLGLVVVD